MVPSTWYQILGNKPGTWLVPSPWYQVLGAKYLVASTWNQLLSRHQVLGTRHLGESAWKDLYVIKLLGYETKATPNNSKAFQIT